MSGLYCICPRLFFCACMAYGCSLATQVAQILIDAKTDDVVVLDVRQQNCGFTDEMVIATARSKLHCQSAAQAVVYKV